MNRLKELRQKKGDTQEDVAKAMGVTRRGYQKWENEESQIKPEKAKQLADFFEVPVGYLLGYDEYYAIENEAMDSYKNMAKLLLTNPELNKIITEYDETNRKNGKWVLSLLVETDNLPIIEQNIKDLILEDFQTTQSGDYDEEVYGTLLDNVSRTYISLGQLPMIFKDFFGAFLTLPTSDKKIIMQLVNSLYEKDKGNGIVEEYSDKK